MYIIVPDILSEALRLGPLLRAAAATTTCMASFDRPSHCACRTVGTNPAASEQTSCVVVARLDGEVPLVLPVVAHPGVVAMATAANRARR